MFIFEVFNCFMLFHYILLLILYLFIRFIYHMFFVSCHNIISKLLTCIFHSYFVSHYLFFYIILNIFLNVFDLLHDVLYHLCLLMFFYYMCDIHFLYLFLFTCFWLFDSNVYWVYYLSSFISLYNIIFTISIFISCWGFFTVFLLFIFIVNLLNLFYFCLYFHSFYYLLF